jgi:hypothetical protein
MLKIVFNLFISISCLTVVIQVTNHSENKGLWFIAGGATSVGLSALFQVFEDLK